MDIIHFLENLHVFSKEIQILIISSLPIIELRGAIPIAYILDLPPIKTFILAYIGSMIPVPFLLHMLKPVFKKIRNYPFFRKKIDNYTHKTLKKINKFKKFSLISLIIFVAIPVPTTGVWTGSFAASITNLDFKKAFLAIAIGNFITGIAVSILTHSTVHFLS